MRRESEGEWRSGTKAAGTKLHDSTELLKGGNGDGGDSDNEEEAPESDLKIVIYLE